MVTGAAPTLLASSPTAALVTFLCYVAVVFVLAWLSNRLLRDRSFLSEYFLGSRSLGVWAFALTFAATSASGGSFTGFPSKIYTHGWILGLWIASYTVVPICSMGLLGKRINQVARLSGAITVPDVLRDRFRSSKFGLLAVTLIVFFMSFNLVAQFKSGSEILKTLLADVGVFQGAVTWVAGATAGNAWVAGVDPAYLVCLFAFACAVILYTTYGGFHAVVWTDVLQGIVMVFGVMVMLPIAIWQVGGMAQATRQMADMTPPRMGLARIDLGDPLADARSFNAPWFAMAGDTGDVPRLFRVSGSLVIPAGESVANHVRVVELTTPHEIRGQLDRLRAAGEIPDGLDGAFADRPAHTGVWLDRQLAGVAGAASRIDLCLAEPYVYGHGQRGVYVTGPGPKPPMLPKRPSTVAVVIPPDAPESRPAPIKIQLIDPGGQTVTERPAGEGVAYVTAEQGEYELVVSAADGRTFRRPVTLSPEASPTVDVVFTVEAARETPAPPAARRAPTLSDGFLPFSIAVSFFFMWAISGTGQPSNMVRLMAFKNTLTLRRSIFTVAIYYSFIYFPLVLIFCCARVLLPGMDLESDRIMPQMAVTLTASIGHAWLAGLLVAAPFAAVMSTVDSFLLMISSGLVRDVYQRNINPQVSERSIKRMSYACTFVVGAGTMLAAVNPPQFLQDIIVYTGSGLAACFLGPMVFALYWPRANVAGCTAGMLAGFASHFAMYAAGWLVNGSFYAPYQLLNVDPIIVGLVVSFATVYVVTRLTPPPPDDLVRKYFYKPRSTPSE